jgi:tetratricopeptide (TPR) repeat protein
MKYLRAFVVIHALFVRLPRPYRTLFWLALVLGAAGCSVEKDAFLNRRFHGMNTRFNGWFHADERLTEVIRGIEDTYVDNYDEVLPLFVYGTEAQARSAVPALEICIEKASLVIERHSMDIKGDEKNAWIDDAWFVIAKSHFYKGNYYEAERGFTYISRRFKGSNRQLESQVWLARTAIQLEQYSKAQSALDKTRDEKKLPKRFDHGELSTVQAELELKRGKVDDAIVHLEHAITVTKSRRERVRRTFILGQLYERKGLQEKAIQQFAAVGKMNPPYEMAFHAQIFQATAFSRGDSKSLRQKLNRMLRDAKHVDHFDMIHYALADLDLKERNKPAAIDNLLASARLNTTDQKQLGKTFLKLADIYFDDREYALAQPYYDSTRTVLPEEHIRFREVDTRANVLGELVEQLNIIELEDSLQMLAGLDEKELEKRIRRMIRDREELEAERERLENENREVEAVKPTGRPAAQVPGSQATRGAWYFYDPPQVSRGVVEFRKKWGTRKLEDDWRRKDKSGSALAESIAEEGEQALADVENERGKDKEKGNEPWRDQAYYTKDLPKDEAAIANSNERICNALYVSGMIFKEQLKDPDNAIESFENLHSRFDECRYTPESFYQLYRIYLEKEQTTNYFSPDGSGSQMYANIILDRYPTSEFARLVRDPNILQADDIRKAAEELAYKEVYQQFRQYSYARVISTANRVIEEEPRNYFLPKYYLLRAMAIGGMRDVSGFKAGLTVVVSTFPGTDEAKAAEELLAVLDRTNDQSSAKAPPSSSAFKQEQGQHYFAIIIPNKGNDINAIKAQLSNFNNTYFRQPGMQITNSFLDPEHQVVLMTFFDTKAKAMEFYTLFKGNMDVLAGINDQDYPAFAISPGNYSTLYKNKDVEAYGAFFAENYLGSQ